MRCETLPINMLVSGRRCLVVGGGKVAARKALALLEAGAQVVVIAPEILDRLEAAASSAPLTLLRRPFQDSDASHFTLAYAATDDPALNRHVHEVCLAHGILCGIVDRGWEFGDFISPAVHRADGLTLAVSSGGLSCRRSRLVKQNLARHIHLIDSADLLIAGTDHRYLDLAAREACHLAPDQMADAGAMLAQILGIHEFLILNTCNRIELLAVASPSPSTESIVNRVLRFDRLPPSGFYQLRGRAAFDHAARVTAGLLSQIPGETHITAQVKDALASATALGWAGPMLQDWITRALHLSKAIRQAVAPLMKSRDIEDVTLDCLRARGPLEGRNALVLGSGALSTGLMQKLLEAGATVSCGYRRRPPKLDPSHASRIHADTLDHLPRLLAGADLILCATASARYVLGLPEADLIARSPARLVVDLSTPRNVDPALRDRIPDLTLVNLDDLKQGAPCGNSDPEAVQRASDQALAAHTDSYDTLVHSFQGRPRQSP